MRHLVKPIARRIAISFLDSSKFAVILELRAKKQRNITMPIMILKTLFSKFFTLVSISDLESSLLSDGLPEKVKLKAPVFAVMA